MMSDPSRRAVILGGARTPFGKLNGALATQNAVDLGVVAARAAIERAGISTADVDNTIFGQVLQGGAGQNPARQVALRAGIGVEIPAETINRVCGSGMRALTLAESLIRAGDFDVVLAGGMESMTNAPYLLRKARTGYRMGDGVLEDMMIGDGLQCAIACCHMGIHGGNVAAEEGISREEQDAWALRSHQRALAAQDAGLLAREIVPVEIAAKGVTTIVDEDEAPRRDTSEEALARLKPVFDPEGTVTAGNAPGINDGAAALVVTSADWADAQGLSPRARILAHAEAAWDVPYLAYTPAMAAEKALARAGLQTVGRRRLGDQRGVRQRSDHLQQAARYRPGPRQRQWRRDRVRPPHRRQRRPDRPQPDRRAAPPRRRSRRGRDLLRRRWRRRDRPRCAGHGVSEGLLLPFDGVFPRIASGVYLAPGSVVIGDVEIGADSSVWFNAVIRGDVAPIRIGERSNVQDGAVLHVDRGTPCIVGDEVTIGHAAIVHGTTVGDGVTIGMGAVVLSRSEIGAEAIVAAAALVPEDAVVASGALVMGVPAREKRSALGRGAGRVARKCAALRPQRRRTPGRRRGSGSGKRLTWRLTSRSTTASRSSR